MVPSRRRRFNDAWTAEGYGQVLGAIVEADAVMAVLPGGIAGHQHVARRKDALELVVICEIAAEQRQVVMADHGAQRTGIDDVDAGALAEDGARGAVDRAGFDSRRARSVLDKTQIPYRYIDIDKDPEGRKFVEQTNHGYCSVPTIVFTDGSILVEPDDTELLAKLGIQ